MAFIRLLPCAVMTGVLCLAADLEQVKAEPDLNKRAEMAMLSAEESLDEASKAYRAGNTSAAHTKLLDIESAVELACDSLRQTKKPPRNNKYYKRVELSMRSLLRRLDDLGHDAPYDDQGSVQKVQKRVQDLHDQILLDIMSKRK